MRVSNRIVRLIISISILLLVLFVVLVLSMPRLVRYFRVEERLRETIQNQLGYPVDFEKLNVSLLPLPTLSLEKFTVSEPEKASQVPILSADQIRIRPSLLALLFHKMEFAHVSFKNTDIHYPWRDKQGAPVKRISLRDASVAFWGIRSNRPVRFKARGKLLGEEENVELAGTFEADFTNLKTETFTYNAEVSVSSVELSKAAAWWGPLPLKIQSGSLAFSGRLRKELDSEDVEITGEFAVQNLIYEMTKITRASAAGDYQLAFALRMNPQTGALAVTDCTLATPFGGPFELRVKMNTSDFLIEEFSIKSDRLHLEALPQSVLVLEEFLPLNLGFSGETRFDVFVKGKPAEFSFNTRVDLKDTTLTYSQYFSKPSGVPLLVRGDLKLIGGRVLRGDFTLEFGGASLKGSVAALDVGTGTGEVTVLTNKFRVDGWNQYFPAVKQLEVSGQSKILASMRGDFRQIARAQLMVNVSLDGLSAEADNGAQIQNLSGNIDLSPADSEVKGIRFDLGGSRFFVEGKMLGTPQPRWLIAVQSEEIAVGDFFEQILKGTEAIGLKKEGVDLESVMGVLNRIVQPEEVFEHLDAQIVLDGKRVLVPRFEFDAYDGRVSIESMVDFSEAGPKTLMDVNIRKLNLARLWVEKPILDGNLFLVASLRSDGPLDPGWLDRLTGEGTFSITNGELHTVDLLGGLGQIAELAAVGTFKSGTTRFNDIGGDLNLEAKRAETENLVLLSDDFHVEGGGDIDLNGNLNYRLSVYLSPALSRRISSKVSEHTRLGPIPILVVGTIEEPSVRTDPMLIQTFLQNLLQERFLSITSKFIPSFRRDLPILAPPRGDQKQEGSPEGSKAPSPSSDLKQALITSGFNLLEQFLSKEKSTS
ncbi:MAG: hypothetical protein A3G87_05835 [Omnitrophica bacterium RIFCSPLOWO2_12_FULL_50_11]|nr:MAG: hypothetical protein A3G87_05835 [Omnitrophica bacterium RIFCSPLOWO2_12_FULL_50_11]